MAEYKNCPVCHTINTPTAVVCECGYRFREGEALSDRDIARAQRKKKLRAAAASCVILAVIAALVFLTVLNGVKILFIILGVAVAVVILTFVVLKIRDIVSKRKGL